MRAITYELACQLKSRARQSRGISNAAIHEMVRRVLRERKVRGGALVDVGCGCGQLQQVIGGRFDRYVAIDAVRYDGLPDGTDFHFADLNSGELTLANDSADVAAAVETIEHLENPRALMRDLVRITKPGGWVFVTTPNQLSWLSLLTLITKHRFNAFQDVHYPAHVTALLEIDLRRIAAECSLEQISIEFSHNGRIPFTSAHFPEWIARQFPRRFSDNVLLIGRKPLR